MKKLKKKTCRVCKSKFQPFSSLSVACSPRCAIALVKITKEKKIKKDLRIRKEKLKTKSDYLREAQKACNAYIRGRDKKEPCISCGRYDHEIKDAFVGGKWDAGHYKSRGAYIELRFHPMNIHRQCKSCNGGSGKYAKKNRTVNENYELNLVDKIGKRMVDWLNGEQEIQNWTIDDLKEIKVFYREQLKVITD